MPQYDGSLKFDTKIDDKNFKKHLNNLKGIANKTIGAIGKGAAALGGVFAGAATGAIALIEKTKELNGDLGKFQANVEASGKNQEFMNEQLKRFTAITGEADSSVEGLSNLLRTTYKEERLEQVLNGLAGAIVAFPDTLKFESLSDSLQETLATGKGVGQFAELLERSGVNLDEFNDALAKAPTQMDKNTVALEYLNNTGLSKLAANYEEANKDQLDYSKNQQELQQQLADLGSEFVPIVNKLFPAFIRLVGKAKDQIKKLSKPVQEITDKFVDMVNGVDGAGQDLVEIVGNMLTNVKDKVMKLVPKIVDEMKGIITKATEYFQSDEGKESIGNAIQTLFSDALSLLKELPDLITKVGDFISSIVDGFFEPENMDKLYDGFIELIETVFLQLVPSLLVAGGKIALKLIDGIVGELKRGERKVRETLEGWGIGSTAKEGLDAYTDSSSDLPPSFGMNKGWYQSSLQAAINRGEKPFSYEEWEAAGHHAPEYKPSVTNNINITGTKVLDPVDTAREVQKVMNHGMVGAR